MKLKNVWDRSGDVFDARVSEVSKAAFKHCRHKKGGGLLRGLFMAFAMWS